MRCQQCGCDRPEGALHCPGCGSSSTIVAGDFGVAKPSAPLHPGAIERPLEALGYATMGERFLAFLCDGSVQTLLVGLFLAVSYSSSSLDFDGLKENALWIIPATYMILAEFFLHGTLGKRLLRIQVRADSSEMPYPTLLQLVLRETLGKFLCWLALGIGFVAGIGAKKKTWADRIAGTVVVKTNAVTAGFKGVLVPILICANIGIGIALTEVPARYRKVLDQQLRTTEARVDELHARILMNLVMANHAESADTYRQALKDLPSMLDEYSRLVATEQKIAWRSRKLATRADLFVLDRLNAYDKANRLRQEIAELAQQHLQMVLSSDPNRQSWEDVQRDRRRLMHDLMIRNNRINQVGDMYIPRKISFDCRVDGC